VEFKWWLGGWYLWFLLFIMLYSIVAALVPARFHLAAAANAYIVALACEDGAKYSERFTFYLSLFLLGSFLGRYRDGVERWAANRWIPLGLLPAILGVCLYSAMERPIRFSPAHALPILIVTAGVLAAGVQAARRYPLPLLQAMGRHSLTIFLVHMPVIALTLRCLSWAGVTSFALTYAASVTLAFAASYGMIAARRHVPAADALFYLPRRRP
jgi:peptidoglycan/LPS O-acetylase OafA/YrhL